MLDEDLQLSLVRCFADTVMRAANLPAARRSDLGKAPSFAATDDEIVCVDGITGCTYTELWDGSEASALAFAERCGENMASLVNDTPHYAWLRAGR